MQRKLGSQVVLLLENVVDRGLPRQKGWSARPIVHSSPWHVLTIRARGGAGGADTQNQQFWCLGGLFTTGVACGSTASSYAVAKEHAQA